jgi:peptidoglycan/xylan/chitin deacetylase (PgdA/CDA1 family)
MPDIIRPTETYFLYYDSNGSQSHAHAHAQVEGNNKPESRASYSGLEKRIQTKLLAGEITPMILSHKSRYVSHSHSHHQHQSRQQKYYTVFPETEHMVRQKLSTGVLPFVPPERSLMTQYALKASMKALFGRGTVKHFGCAPYRDDKSTLFYFDVAKYPGVKGHVALSFDDAPCRFRSQSRSEVSAVQSILKDHGDAKATFMCIGEWCEHPHNHKHALISLLQNGHELGNHGMMDRSYEHDSPEDFAAAVKECSTILQRIQQEAGVIVPTRPDNNNNNSNSETSTSTSNVRWFRAPHGRYTAEMARIIQTQGLTNVMCDTYASCPIVQDPIFIAQHLAQRCQDGSIILLHMPEKPTRQWCLDALKELLTLLQHQRGFKVVTVSDLERLAHHGKDVGRGS